MASTAAAQAGPGPDKVRAVIELFTSQGCSSCPPADTLLKTYVDRPGVLALTLPVDYWDYLGWKDTYASARNSERQRVYARTRGDGAVYTPQAVVNGRLHAVGSSAKDIDKALSRLGVASPLNVALDIRKEGSSLVIEAGAGAVGAGREGATLWLALVQPEGVVPVKRGENSGRTLTYTNIVREMTAVGMWSGEAVTIKLAASDVMMPDTTACAVILQQGNGGPILGAAWLKAP
ncbi:MAG: DUF1223 domain-containing protein [Hyphomicrobiaceae bacterium]|nr:DUF1223 domain-containing protein [Hyphomicrobiaceae bacterium]